MKTVPDGVPYCRGTVCDKPLVCDMKGVCQYKSSAEEAKEIRSLKTVVEETAAPQIDLFPVNKYENKAAWCTNETSTSARDLRSVSENSLPTSSTQRKEIPLARGVLDYFPAALAEIAKLSKAGNDKHNPGQDLHWARGKSMDHADCIMRHLIDRGTIDPEDRMSHTVKVAWRALALLQEECEAMGAPMARGAR